MNKADIAKLIPHSDAMCLLDSVVHWNATTIRCISRNHQDKDNPMRRGDALPAICGVEYAAQAMAVHGSLVGAVDKRPRAGYLASLRDIECKLNRLDDLTGDLSVDAERLMGDEHRVIYQFILRVGDVEVLSGRAAVVLDAN